MNSFSMRVAGLLAPLVILTVGTAHAGALSASDIFSQFNVVVFGTFSSTSDVEGRTVVGGNLTGGATFDLNPAGAAASSYSALTVYGSVTSGGNFNIDNGGGLTIAGSNAGSFNLNGGGFASVGGSNSGNISATNGSGTVTVGGGNSGTLQLSNGGTVYVGGGNAGAITLNNGSASTNSVSVIGNNTNTITVNGSGSVAIAGNTGSVNLNGGSLSYTGSQTGNLNMNGGASATHVSSVNPTAPTSTAGSFASTFQIPLTNLSTQLNGVAANSTVTSANGTITFNATPNKSGVAVFDINTSLFAPNSTVQINLDGATSVIINVNVDSCVSSNCAFTLPNSVNFSDPTDYASQVLWNFVNATNLTFSNEFGGSVLAPLAAVTNNGPIDGTVVANSYSGNGEVHSHPYTGTLPGGTQLVGSSGNPVPEPGSMALIVSGLLGLTAIRWQQRRKSKLTRLYEAALRMHRDGSADGLLPAAAATRAAYC
jgi:choice-of-anchor A domain-containing protein